MKRFWISLMIAMMVVAVAFVAAACDKSSSGTDESASTSYTIQYTDAGGTHTITVESGNPYSITAIPEKEGYAFLGLYDSKAGGTQYVDDTGTSLSVFTDKKNMVLFPQFAPKEYVVVLDYQGAAVTGSRQFTVDYDAAIPDLPKSLTLDNKTFTGWYTEPDRGGTQVADEYGNLPLVSTLNSENFDLSGKSITLYAGFMGQQYVVTFYADGRSEEKKVTHGTPISSVVPSFRKNGQAVYRWSKLQNDIEGSEVFMGSVTGDLILYAQEWAPVLEFDVAGGKAVSAIVAKAGSSISLPTPTRKDYTFAGWYTAGGSKITATSMPAEGQTLTAHWNAQLTFNSNGGTSVSPISQEAGTALSIPTPTRSGYIFAGWYRGNERFTSTTMPDVPMTLTAKYHKHETTTVAIVSKEVMRGNSYEFSGNGFQPSMEDNNYPTYAEFDLSELYNAGVRDVKIKMHYSVRSRFSDNIKSLCVDLCFQKVPNSAYAFVSSAVKYDDNNWHDVVVEKATTLRSGINYACWYIVRDGSSGYVNGWWRDIWLEIEYPDMVTLY